MRAFDLPSCFTTVLSDGVAIATPCSDKSARVSLFRAGSSFIRPGLDAPLTGDEAAVSSANTQRYRYSAYKIGCRPKSGSHRYGAPRPKSALARKTAKTAVS